MINALTQSPIVGKIFEWRTNRESTTFGARYHRHRPTYEDFEASEDKDDLKIEKKAKDKKLKIKIKIIRKQKRR